MTAFILRRLLVTLVTVLGAMVLLFTILQLIPGDFATVVLGPRATPEIIEGFRVRMGLDQPIYVQLFNFILNAAQGDLGTDVLSHLPVSFLVMQVLPHTIVLALSAILIASFLGIPLGAYAAAYKGSWLDRILGVISISAITIPSFLAGLLGLLIFSVFLGWFPAMGAGQSGNLADQFYHLILPALALGLGWIGYIARIMRASMLDEMTEDYVRTARSKGLKESVVVFKHALRGALIPVIAVIGVGFGNLLGGAVLIEIIFHRPGLGYLIYTAIGTRNFPIVQGGLIIAVLLYSLANLLADLSYSFIDPRVRSD